MRRGSVIGPLILIGLGVLFLFRNLWPDIPLVELISRFWPFLLIAWRNPSDRDPVLVCDGQAAAAQWRVGRRMGADFRDLYRGRHDVHGA